MSTTSATFDNTTFATPNFDNFKNLVKNLGIQEGIIRNNVNEVRSIDGMNQSERIQLVSYQYQYSFFFIICVILILYLYSILSGGDTSKIDMIVMMIILLLLIHHFFSRYFSRL